MLFTELSDLLSSMLWKNPEERATMEDIMTHPFMASRVFIEEYDFADPLKKPGEIRQRSTL